VKARTGTTRLEIARKLLLGYEDGWNWLFQYLSEGGPSSRSILRLFRTLPPYVERRLLEWIKTLGVSREGPVALALREIARGRVDRVELHPTHEVLAMHYPAALSRLRSP
jgi:hypothetical protein